MDSEPERPSLLRLLSLSESDGDLQTDCSFASSSGKVSGRSNDPKYLETVFVELYIHPLWSCVDWIGRTCWGVVRKRSFQSYLPLGYFIFYQKQKTSYYFILFPLPTRRWQLNRAWKCRRKVFYNQIAPCVLFGVGKKSGINLQSWMFTNTVVLKNKHLN